jgi:hypothetical protein
VEAGSVRIADFIGIGLALSALAAGAARAADAPGLAVTIYNQNRALVDDVRRMAIAQGRQRLELKDVSAAIEPETVTLEAPGVSIVEQNFDFDLLTPQKMMEKAVGHQVQIVRTNPGNGAQVTETATVLSANQGVILKIGDRVEVLRDDGVPTRVIFDGVPQDLRAQPTLSVTVDSDHAGDRLVDLSYLTTGLAWRADYVALFDEPDGKLDLQGWYTLTNTSGTPFVDAAIDLVAGDVGIGGDVASHRRRPILAPAPARGMVQAGDERHTGPGEALGDVYIYRLPERTTVAQNQTKQVSFLDARGDEAHKVYRWSAAALVNADEPSHVQSVIAFANQGARGLGASLPAGTIRVYQKDARGQSTFVGEAQIDHTPQGSELAITIGEAFDVTVKPTLVSSQQLSPTHQLVSMRYALHNAKDTPVTVELRQGGLYTRTSVVRRESLPGRQIDAYTRGWSVPVPADGDLLLTADFDIGA